jgi:malonyl-CoA/methylmalonyl-CoA synthetase
MTTPQHLWQRAVQHADRTAIVSPEGAWTYSELLSASALVAAALLDGRRDLDEARVAFLVPPGFDYAALQWGVWRAGGVAVPLAVMHPPAEWQYVLDDAEAEALVVHSEFAAAAESLASPRRLTTAQVVAASASAPLPEVAPSRRAMILYTSGTTGKPKGVVTTHANIHAQIASLVEAWQWSADDRILHVLPLHHIHGVINVLACALWSGATCEFLPKFDAAQVLRRFAPGDLTLFMAVPTIYARLAAAWDPLGREEQQHVRRGCQSMRLMVSGSAALPVAMLERWRELTGHVLLERYGMTEIGMALSNPLHGERRPGRVGTPLPQVEVRLVDEAGRAVAPGEPSEIEARGPGVFLEYWRRPEATAAAFRDGWFRTGDVAVVEEGAYRILGRMSSDIIKTGGYKVSALEIEETLRAHPQVRDCAVVGLADDEWGERVAACIVAEGDEPKLESLRAWAKDRLAPYKVPTRLLCAAELPRNAMGKVQKPAVRELFEQDPS